MAGSTNSSVELAMTAGLPYRRRIRVTGATSMWPTLDDFEVRSQIRAGRDVNSQFLHDLGQYITPSIEGDDIILTLELTGAQTRLLPVKGNYDVIISDPGVDDAKALPALSGKIKVGQLITGPADD